MVKKGTFASPAMARASSVLPVPGGPTSSTPFGILPPRRWNFCGSRRNSTISSSSALASSMPATSSKVTRPCFSVSSRARRLAEAHGPAAARLHLAHEEHPDADQQQHREPGEQVVEERVDVALLRPRHDADALLGQLADQGRVFRRVGLEGAAVGELAADGAALDHDVADVAGADLVQEVGVGEACCAACRRCVEGWNRLNSATSSSATMTQSARLRPKLFTDAHPVQPRPRFGRRIVQAPRPETLLPGDGVDRAGSPMVRPRTSARARVAAGLNRRPDRPPGRKPARNARMSPGQDKAARAPPPARRRAGRREKSRGPSPASPRAARAQRRRRGRPRAPTAQSGAPGPVSAEPAVPDGARPGRNRRSPPRSARAGAASLRRRPAAARRRRASRRPAAGGAAPPPAAAAVRAPPTARSSAASAASATAIRARARRGSSSAWPSGWRPRGGGQPRGDRRPPPPRGGARRPRRPRPAQRWPRRSPAGSASARRSPARAKRGSALVGSRTGRRPAAATTASSRAGATPSSGRSTSAAGSARAGAMAARPAGPLPRERAEQQRFRLVGAVVAEQQPGPPRFARRPPASPRAAPPAPAPARPAPAAGRAAATGPRSRAAASSASDAVGLRRAFRPQAVVRHQGEQVAAAPAAPSPPRAARAPGCAGRRTRRPRGGAPRRTGRAAP